MSSKKRDNLIFFGDVNSDGICDVKDDKGVVYLGGVTAVYPPRSQRGSVAKLIITVCYRQLAVFLSLKRFNIWYKS